MARRQGAVTKSQTGQLTEREAVDLHRAVRRHFHRITNTDGINLAEYHAQLYEQDMVDVLVKMALDVTGYTSPSLRRACALDVVQIARGAIKQWNHDGQTIDPAAPGRDPDTTIGDQIDAAKASAELAKEFHRLVSERIPPAQWPAAIRELAGSNLAFYSESTTS